VAGGVSGARGLGALGQQLIDHPARDIRQPEIAALEFECQLGVVKPQQMQHGGVQIVDLDLLV
jgi:hypothetical protein